MKSLVLPLSLIMTLCGGMLLPAQTLYWGGGTTDITGPQAPAQINGTWDNTIQNWGQDPAGNTYGAWSPGSIADFGSSGNNVDVTVSADLSLAGVVYENTSGGGRRLLLDDGGIGHTLTLTGADPVLEISTQRGGTGSALEIGGSLQMIAPNGLTVRRPSLNSGFLRLSSTATQDVDNYILESGGGLEVGGSNADRIKDSAIITMGANTTLAHSGSNNNYVETIGTLDFVDQLITISTNTRPNSGFVVGTAFDRGSHGVVRFFNLDDPDASFAITGSGKPITDVSLPWAVYGGRAPRFAQYDSTNDTFAILTTDVQGPTDLTTWDSQLYTAASDVYYTWGLGDGNPGPFTGALDADLALRTLAIGPSSTSEGDNTLDLGGFTLTTQALAMGSQGGSSTRFIIQNGNVTAPGSELYLHFEGTDMDFDANLTGANDIIAAPASGTLEFRALTTDNTYTGAFIIVGGGGSVQFTGSGQKVTGDLILEQGATVTLGAANQIADTGVVTVKDNATLFSNSTETIAGLQGAGEVAMGTGGNANKNLTIDTAGNDYTFSGTLAGVDGNGGSTLTKAGAGTLTLSGDNTYDQATVVSGGTLLVEGTHTANGEGYTIQSGGTLGGSGEINLATGNVDVQDGASFAPGSSIGEMTITTPTFTLGGEFVAEFDGASSDLLTLTGTFDISGSTDVLRLENFGSGVLGGQAYTIATFSSLNGTFDTITNNTGFTLDTSFGSGGIDYLATSIEVRFIPEPSTAVLMLAGLGILGLSRRRRA